MANRTPGYIDGRRFRVGNVPTWGSVPDVPIPGTMEAYGIFDDFLSCEDLNAAGSTPTDQGVWEFWIQNAATIAQADEVGGNAIITCGGLNEDSGQITLGCLKSARSGGAFFPAAGKHLWFEARAKATNLGTGQLNIFLGLIAPVNAAILADAGGALPNNNMLGFVVRDGETDYSFVGDKAAAEDYNGLGVAIDTSYHYFGFYVNGVTDVAVYLDRTLIAAGAVLTANIPVVGLMPAFAIKAGSAAAETLTIDYVMCVQLR